MKRTPRAMTLIEVLICIAILTIISTSLIAFLIQPARELIVSQAHLDQSGGGALLFRVLAEDLHGAERVQQDEAKRMVAFIPVQSEAAVPLYFLDDDQRLRRALMDSDEAEDFLRVEAIPVPPPGSVLMTGITRWEASPNEEGSRWTFAVESHRNVLQQDRIFSREASYSIGRPWLSTPEVVQ